MARPRGSTCLEQADDRGEDERDDGRDHEDDQHRAGRAGQGPEAEQGEREHHELDPSGHDHRCDRRRPLRIRAVVPGQVCVAVLVPGRRVARVGARAGRIRALGAVDPASWARPSSSTGPPAWTAAESGSPSGSGGSAVRGRAHRRILVIMRVTGANP